MADCRMLCMVDRVNLPLHDVQVARCMGQWCCYILFLCYNLFPNGRLQKVMVDCVSVTFDVPQCTVINLLQYMSDVPVILENTFVGYADDSALLAEHSNPSNIEEYETFADVLVLIGLSMTKRGTWEITLGILPVTHREQFCYSDVELMLVLAF